MLVFNKDSCYVFYYVLSGFKMCCTQTHTHTQKKKTTTHASYTNIHTHTHTCTRTQREVTEQAETKEKQHGSKPATVIHPYGFTVLKL